MKKRTYSSCVAYIEELPKFTEKHSLAICRQLLKKVSIEQATRTIIHVAGTNGKGSVSIYMEGMLLSMGEQVGCFVSPHLLTMRERIRINGEAISEAFFCELFQEIHSISMQAKREGISHPTYFEFLFLMSELAFSRKNVSYAIVEVGIGGRLDATNCMPSVSLSVITSIGLDHCDILGSSIEEITAEKGGIIREKTTVVYDANDDRSTKVIEKIASERESKAFGVSKDEAEDVRFCGKNLAFSCKNMYDSFEVWEIKGHGFYQIQNAMLAIRAMEVLSKEKKLSVDIATWKKALRGICWPGRMEEVSSNIILDGAHNEDAIRMLMESIAKKQAMQTKPMSFLIAIGSEKDGEKIFKMIASYFPNTRCIVTAIQDKRRMDSSQLKKLASQYLTGEIIEVKSVRQAFLLACVTIEKDEVLYCFGSLYLVGEIKQVLMEEQLC